MSACQKLEPGLLNYLGDNEQDKTGEFFSCNIFYSCE